MSRGWESKDVESQQNAGPRIHEHRAPLSADEKARAQRRRALELSRSRARQELAVTTAAVRRAALESALAELEREIVALGGDGGG